MGRKKALAGLLFATLFLLISALVGASGAGVAVLNVEWLFLVGNIVFFAFIGYIIRLLIEGGSLKLPRKRGKLRKRDVISGLITLIAFIYALYRLFHRTPEKQAPPSGGGAVHRIVSESLKAGRDILILISKPLPSILYLLPVLAFFFMILRARRRKTAWEELAKSFDPWLSYETVGGSPAERVIKMYKNVVAGLVRKGYPYQKSWTHWEHEEKLREIFPDLADLDVLTRIFEKARYANSLDDDDVEAARESYEKLMEFLR